MIPIAAMTRQLPLVGLAILLALAPSPADTAPPRQQETAPREAADAARDGRIDRPIRVLDLTGSPYQRGLAHGRALGDEIRHMLTDFKNDLQRTYHIPADEFIQRFLAETDFQTAIEEWTPGLLDEVRGIADGAGQSFDDIYVFQLADEIWSMGGWAVRDKCTAAAVARRGRQPTIVAQNLDVPGFYHTYPTVLRIHEAGDRVTMVLTCPGLIGVNGMNSAPLAVCCNALLQLRPSRAGVPCLFVVRGVLAQNTFDDAEDWLQRVPHAVGQNYTLGDRARVRALECSASGAVLFEPRPGADFTYHTNHPLASRDWHPDYVSQCAQRQVAPEDGLPVCHRFQSLQQRLPDDRPITEATIVEALASRDDPAGPICGDWTYACTLFVLGDRPVLHMAPGRADRYRMQTIECKTP